MTTTTRFTRVLALAGCAIAIQTAAPAEEPFAGAALYEAKCRVCHGADATGGGPLAEFMTVAPSNLRQLSAQNDGEFPFMRVLDVIDGRADVAVHGGRDMPIWGEFFSLDEREGTPDARARLLTLTLYLESIQDQ